MNTDNGIFEKISKAFEKERIDNEFELKKRKNEIYKIIPEIKIIDMQLKDYSAKLLKSVFEGKNISDEIIKNLHDEQQKALLKRSELLIAAGYSADYLDLKYNCPECSDYGYIGTRMCSCFRERLENEQYKAKERADIVNGETFDNFNLNYYSDIKSIDGITYRNNAANIYSQLLEYANDFENRRESIILTGATGLGKTYLAKSVANALISRKYDIIMDTAQNIFDMLEADKFGRGDGNNTKRIKNCALLIIDDLGSEFVNNFTISALYNILNTRGNNGLRMIITTNLSFEQLEKIYQYRIVSRIIGSFNVFKFIGDDIRQIKNKERLM